MIYIGYHWNCRLWRYSTKGNALWGTPPGQKRERWFWKIKRSPFIIWFNYWKKGIKIQKTDSILLCFCWMIFWSWFPPKISLQVYFHAVPTLGGKSLWRHWNSPAYHVLKKWLKCVTCAMGCWESTKKRVIIRGSKDCCDMVDNLGDSWFLLKGP